MLVSVFTITYTNSLLIIPPQAVLDTSLILYLEGTGEIPVPSQGLGISLTK
jgi:hypothetical protein